MYWKDWILDAAISENTRPDIGHEPTMNIPHDVLQMLDVTITPHSFTQAIIMYQIFYCY